MTGFLPGRSYIDDFSPQGGQKEAWRHASFFISSFVICFVRLSLRGTLLAATFLILFLFSYNFYFFPSTRGGALLCLSPYLSLNFSFIPSTRSGRAGAPTFWPAESRQRLAKEGCAPFGIPPAVALARPSAAIRARGVTELLAAYAAGASGRFAGALPQSLIGRGTMRWRA